MREPTKGVVGPFYDGKNGRVKSTLIQGCFEAGQVGEIQWLGSGRLRMGDRDGVFENQFQAKGAGRPSSQAMDSDNSLQSGARLVI